MPVQALTTSAISSGPTSCRSRRRPPWRSRRGTGRIELLRELFALGIQFVEFLVIFLGHDLAGCLLLANRGPELVVLAARPDRVAGACRPRCRRPCFSASHCSRKIGQLEAQIGHFGLDLLAAVDGVLFGLFGQLPRGQFQLHQPALHLVDLARHAFQFHRQPAGGFVHQVDGLVGQKAIGDVAVRQLGGRHQGRVLDLHALVMGLVARLQAAQDGDRVFDVRLADKDRLEAALQGGVFLDVLAIFVERRGADAAQLAAGQGRLEQVGGVVAPFGRSGADDRVQLVDEQNHVAAGGLDFAQHRLEPIFELAAKLGAGDQRAHVERDHALVLQALRHVALDDPQGQPFGDGGLADARLADQHRIVLGAPREDLDHAADFLVAADHRIELALAGPFDQIDAVFFQGVEFFLGILIGHPGRAAHGLQGLEQAGFVDGVELENALGLRVDLGQGQQQMLGRDELVLHLRGKPAGPLRASFAAPPTDPGRCRPRLWAGAPARPRRSVRAGGG